MARINSKKKGNRFEREVCKIFQAWTGYEFSRVPQSGGLRWKDTQSITSDVICTDDRYNRRWPFTIECKSYNELKFEHLLLEKKSCKINSFWDQAKRDAKRANKKPLLIMKYNGMSKGEAFLVCDSSVNKVFLNYGELLDKPRMDILTKDSLKDLHIYMLSQLTSLPVKEIVNKVRKLLKR